ncbi:MAG: hypothetical protein PHU27_01760 [Salinivirgaceae bacterium]|nr:hypothetical protein [Salinivirgaceae bacterium]MDD4746936.1 hypothetical protein [Salinivirgaceae bacterium]MDY0280213.1 hypothetical protein [Salinivirgaceae bacterium]
MQIGNLISRIYALHKIGISLLFIFGLHTLGISQKCNLEVNQVDPVTNAVIKRTADESVGRLNGQPLYFKAQCIGEKKYLKMRYYRYGDFTISEETPLIITFLDESTLEIMPRKSRRSQSADETLTSVSSLMIFDIDKNQYTTISKQPIKQITVQTETNETIVTDIRERFRLVLQEILNCVEL